MQPDDQLKKFVFNGILTVRELQELSKGIDTQGLDLVPLMVAGESTDPSWYPADLVAAAKKMTRAYFRFYLFENRVRLLVEKILKEKYGAEWFEKAVPPTIKDGAARRKAAEGLARFHAPRGEGLLPYIGLPDLGAIIVHNWDVFESIFYRKDWVQVKMEELRLTRNAIAHMGEIGNDDFERLDGNLRDWNKQVG